MDEDDFWSGVRLVVTGLADAAKQASYSLGFGAGGLGGTLLALKRLDVTGVELTLIAMSAFFIAARIGKVLDNRSERALREAKVENDLKLKEAENRYKPDKFYKWFGFLRRLVDEESRNRREEIFRELQMELEQYRSDEFYRWLGFLRRLVNEESRNRREEIFRDFQVEFDQYIRSGY
jgi:hypothetical protein